jgi:hypothetical protein
MGIQLQTFFAPNFPPFAPNLKSFVPANRTPLRGFLEDSRTQLWIISNLLNVMLSSSIGVLEQNKQEIQHIGIFFYEPFSLTLSKF